MPDMTSFQKEEWSTKGIEEEDGVENEQTLMSVSSAVSSLDDSTAENIRQKAKDIYYGKMLPSQIGPFLGKNKPYNVAVLQEFVKLFDFKGKSLDEAFRHFLTKFSLTGETQEIDRIVEQFSKRYYELNGENSPFKNWSVVHTVVSSILILNTDLHTGMVEKKMTKNDFINNTNLALLPEEQLLPDFLKKIYTSIKTEQILLTLDENDPRLTKTSQTDLFRTATFSQAHGNQSMSQLTSDQNSLRGKSAEQLEYAMKGLLIKKNVMDSRDQISNNRQWKHVYAMLSDSGLYLYKPHPSGRVSKEEKLLELIPVRHLFCKNILEYKERINVFSLQTHLGAKYYFQCPSGELVNEWIQKIHEISARLSAPALAAAVGSSLQLFPNSSRANLTFTPPILPLADTFHSMDKQLEYFQKQVKKFQDDVYEHVKLRDEITGNDKGKGSLTVKKLADWEKKMTYLNDESKRYQEYAEILENMLGEIDKEQDKDQDKGKEKPKEKERAKEKEKEDKLEGDSNAKNEHHQQSEPEQRPL